MRPIDADALKKMYANAQAFLPGELTMSALSVMKDIDLMPTVTLDDLREKGEWVTLDPTVALRGCSRCEHLIYHVVSKPMPNYCPNCGAKMGGGE